MFLTHYLWTCLHVFDVCSTYHDFEQTVKINSGCPETVIKCLWTLHLKWSLSFLKKHLLITTENSLGKNLNTFHQRIFFCPIMIVLEITYSISSMYLYNSQWLNSGLLSCLCPLNNRPHLCLKSSKYNFHGKSIWTNAIV